MQDGFDRMVESYKERILEEAKDSNTLRRRINQLKAEAEEEYARKERGLKDLGQWNDIELRNITLSTADTKRKAVKVAVAQLLDDETIKIKFKLGEGLPYAVSKATGINPQTAKILNPKEGANRIFKALFELGIHAAPLIIFSMFGILKFMNAIPIFGAIFSLWVFVSAILGAINFFRCLFGRDPFHIRGLSPQEFFQ